MLRSLKLPRHLADDDKELYSIIARDVWRANEFNQGQQNSLSLEDVIGLVTRLSMNFPVTKLFYKKPSLACRLGFKQQFLNFITGKCQRGLRRRAVAPIATSRDLQVTIGQN